MPENILLDAALQYAARGWRVVPLHSIQSDGSCTCRKQEACPTPGKHPRIKTGKDHHNASADPAQVEAWWRRWPNANVGLTDFTVVDVDGQGGLDLLRELIAQHDPLPETMTAASGRDGIGLHFYFFPNALRNSSGGGLDLRARGGLVVAPPSLHASGRRYRWVREMSVARMPDWLTHWFANRPASKQDRGRKTESGTRGQVTDSFAEEFAGLGPKPVWLGASSRAAVAPAAHKAVDPLPPIGDVAAAVELLRNDDLGWDEWSSTGMLIWACTGGSLEGRKLFGAFSRKSRKHDEAACDERWEHWATSPPGRWSFGSLVYMAQQVDENWEPPSRRKVLVDPHGAIEAHKETESGIVGKSRELPESPFDPVDLKVNGHHAAAAVLPVSFNEPTGPSPLISLNKQYAVIGDVGGKCLVLGWVPSKVDETLKVPSFQSFKSFSERYASTYIAIKHLNGKGETVEEPRQIGAYWLKWTGRRSYEGIELEPLREPVLPGNVMNLWSGFGVEAQEGSWGLMQRHIVEVLAGGDVEAARYIARFAAWAVQNPGERAEVALVFRGGKGSGKGTFANALRRLFGQHGLQIFNSKHLVGSFNGHLRNCLLLFADEAFWAGDKQGESVLKGMLTESVLMIEQKGVDAQQWRNRLHVIMAANAEWVVPASHDERRYAVFDVSDARIGDRKYFAALHHEIRNGGLAAMLWDLQRMQLGDWHPRDILHNEALRKQKERSLSPLQEWWLEILDNGKIPYSLKDAPHKAGANNLLAHARERYPKLRDLSPQALGRYLGELGCERLHRRDGNFWDFGDLKARREHWVRQFHGWKFLRDVSDWEV